MPTSSFEPAVNFPTRPLQIAPKSVSAPKLGVFAIVIMLALGLFLTIWQAPGLWRDAQIKLDPVATEDFGLIEGECETRQLVFTSCDTHFLYQVDEQIYEEEASFMILDWSNSDYEVEVIYSAKDPMLASLSLGIDKFWNRLAIWGVLVALFYGSAIWMTYLMVRTARDRRSLSRPGVLTPIGVEIRNVQAKRRSSFITYGEKTDKRFKRSYFTKFQKGAEPLYLYDAEGKPYGLAVKHEGSRAPVLLDQALMRVEMTDAERAALQNSIWAHPHGSGSQFLPPQETGYGPPTPGPGAPGGGPAPGAAPHHGPSPQSGGAPQPGAGAQPGPGPHWGYNQPPKPGEPGQPGGMPGPSGPSESGGAPGPSGPGGAPGSSGPGPDAPGRGPESAGGPAQ